MRCASRPAPTVILIVVSPQFDHTAGIKTFKLPDPNPQGETIINIPGSYDVVAGMYGCTGTCTVTKASGDGYTLTGGGTWSFKPANPEDTLAPMPDTAYVVYGWWLHESPGGTATADVFWNLRGNATERADALRVDVAALHGTATYRGGAAGLYALKSSTGGTNDAGQFTADAGLVATFNGGGTRDDGSIKGTIDNFIGGDSMSRDWSVALKEVNFADLGAIPVFVSAGNDKTAWTVNGTAAADSGRWSGSYFEQDSSSGVPQVVTGTFYTTYDRVGRMLGAFGTNLEE